MLFEQLRVTTCVASAVQEQRGGHLTAKRYTVEVKRNQSRLERERIDRRGQVREKPTHGDPERRGEERKERRERRASEKHPPREKVMDTASE